MNATDNTMLEFYIRNAAPLRTFKSQTGVATKT